MEIQCPKCHFVQPNDQYCARCGVDMQKYKPQSTSVFNKLNLQTSILFLIAMAVLGLTIFIFRKSDKPLTNTFNQFSAVKSFRTSEKSGTPAVTTEAATLADTTANTNEENVKPETVDLKVSDEVQLEQFSGGSENRSQTAGTTSNKEFSNPRIKISFIEISADQVNAMLVESHNHGLLQREADSYKGILPNISSLAQYRYKTLKQEVKDLRPNQIEAFFFGKTSSDSSQFMGLQLNLEKKSADSANGSGGSWILTANISKNENKETDSVEFTLNKNAVFFINAKNWISNFENERLLSDTPPFSALSSSDFLNQRSDIIILLENY